MAAIAAAGMWNNPRYKNASFSTIAKMAAAHADVLIAELAKGISHDPTLYHQIHSRMVQLEG
jgi:hypothetical protein